MFEASVSPGSFRPQIAMPFTPFTEQQAPALHPILGVGSLKKNEPRCHTPAPQAEFRLDKRLSQMGVAMPGRQVSITKGVR